MSIPTFQEIMSPLLNALANDNKEHSLKELNTILVKHFHLGDQEQSQLLPSGTQGVFVNRVSWANYYMMKAGLIDRVGRGTYKITDIGQQDIQKNKTPITISYLRKHYPEFLKFINVNNNKSNQLMATPESSTPIDIIENNFTYLNNQLVDTLLHNIKQESPRFFELLVADLLIAMGYGSSKQDILQISGFSGDKGIDGIIKQDKLGLDKVYLQAKRWKNKVGGPDILHFIGALQHQGASKGVFITTSEYTQAALDCAKSNNCNIVLIDGNTLCNLMIEHNVGVKIKTKYEIKYIDEDYFTTEIII